MQISPCSFASQNWYAYVHNDPVNCVDLWGLTASDSQDTRGGQLEKAFSGSKTTDFSSIDQQLTGFNQSVLIMNVAPNDIITDRREDAVEYDLNNLKNSNVVNIENMSEFDYVLEHLPDSVTDLIITGAHGNEKGKLGVIDFSKSTVTNLGKDINVYLPDCYMGTESNMTNLEAIFGLNADIFARDYATWEEGVSNFIRESSNTKNVPSYKIQSNFNQFVRK